MLVDSHTHLDFDDFNDDFAEVITRAKQGGVSHMMSVATSLGNFSKVIRRIKNIENCFASVGLHPCNVATQPKLKAKELVALSANPKVIALGECGLDYYRGDDNSADQKDAFQAHIEASFETDLPIIVHTRSAGNDTIDILKANNGTKGVIHCFTESMDFAKKALDLGFYISFSGIVTFKNAKEIQEVCKYAPSDRILVETDAPYLAPIPYRGKRNEPSYVQHTAQFIAELRGVSYTEIAEVTTNNFFNLFNKARR